MLWKVVANRLCVVFANQMACMTSNVFWELDDVHFKPQKKKVLLIMDNFATHSRKHVVRGESFGFSTLQLSKIIIAFFLPDGTSMSNSRSWNNCFIHSLV